MGTEFTYSLKICIGPAKMCTRKLYMNESCLLQCLSSSCPMSLSSYRTSWYCIALLEYNKILLGEIYCEDMGIWRTVFWCRASSLTPVEYVLGTFSWDFRCGPRVFESGLRVFTSKCRPQQLSLLLLIVLLCVLLRAAVVVLLGSLLCVHIGSIVLLTPPEGEVFLVPDSGLEGADKLVDVRLLLVYHLHVLWSLKVITEVELEAHGEDGASVIPDAVDTLVLDGWVELLPVRIESTHWLSSCGFSRLCTERLGEKERREVGWKKGGGEGGEGGGRRASMLLLPWVGHCTCRLMTSKLGRSLPFKRRRGGRRRRRRRFFIRKKGLITYLRAFERRSSGSQHIVETTTERISTPFCKLNFPLIDKTTSYFHLNLLVWLFKVDYLWVVIRIVH